MVKTLIQNPSVSPKSDHLRVKTTSGTAFGCPHSFPGHRFVYAVISQRARGLSIGINMNPDRHCNFDCVYCEVDRTLPAPGMRLDPDAMADELRETLEIVRSGRIKEFSYFGLIRDEFLKLQHVALSGDGEPTTAPNFAEALRSVMHVRARTSSFFKVVLITNATGLHLPEVQQGLRFFTSEDEIWAKLEAGTQEYMHRVNGTDVPLEKVLENILLIAVRRPVVIQSLFPSINGQEPPQNEIAEYTERLRKLRDQGAQISLVQIYSATRPSSHSECGHLPLRTLSAIAQTVRKATGLKVEVF